MASLLARRGSYAVIAGSGLLCGHRLAFAEPEPEHVPLGVFRTILCFWHSDRDELPCCEESAPFLSYRRSRGTAS